MQGFALTETAEIEVLAAYSAPQQAIAAVAASPGWYVVGAFFLQTSATLKLELVGAVSHASLTMRARVFDLTSNQPVSGISVSISGATSTTDQKVLSGPAPLTGNRTYQIQAEVTGNAGGSYFGVVRSAGPTV